MVGGSLSAAGILRDKSDTLMGGKEATGSFISGTQAYFLNPLEIPSNLCLSLGS